MPASKRVSKKVKLDEIAEVLTHGEIEIEGRLVEASNTTLRGVVTLHDVSLTCVYKPRQGERPLWDFAEGTLGFREIATYRIAEALNWNCVPTTVWRESGPLGEGMCQLWIDPSPEAVVDIVPRAEVPLGWRHIVDAEDYAGQPVSLVHADTPELQRLAILDAITNNTDRKGGHILVDAVGGIFGIDHGVCFHREDKLRTVLWGWIDEPIPADIVVNLQSIRGQISSGLLDDWLTVTEIDATIARIDRLLESGTFPSPNGSWPPLPWPAF
ncbi:MAG: SCO1664 family protein [Actinobacteria bacterium]|nr:SCO1664 family protein [Actinomycetota bacterium]